MHVFSLEVVILSIGLLHTVLVTAELCYAKLVFLLRVFACGKSMFRKQLAIEDWNVCSTR